MTTAMRVPNSCADNGVTEPRRELVLNARSDGSYGQNRGEAKPNMRDGAQEAYGSERTSAHQSLSGFSTVEKMARLGEPAPSIQSSRRAVTTGRVAARIAGSS